MPSFEATMTSKGQITIPARLRGMLNLKPGDRLEFYLDRTNHLIVRPRNLSPTAVFENAPKRRAPDKKMTDDEAIAAAVTAKDWRSRRRGRTSR